jgi:gas vesicle protein
MGQTAEELKHEIESTREDLGETLDAIGDRVSPGRMVNRRKNRMLAGLHSIRERVMGTASEARDRVTAPVHGALEAGSDSMSTATDAVREAPELLRERTQGNPLVVGLLAAGAGFLVATLLPASEAEQQAEQRLATRAQPLTDELSEAGREVAEHLKQPALEAVDHVKETAHDGASRVADHAREATTEVADQARTTTDHAQGDPEAE